MENPSKNTNIISAAISMISNLIISPFLFALYLFVLLVRSLSGIVLSLVPQIITKKFRNIQELAYGLYERLRRVASFVFNLRKNKIEYE